MLKLILVVFLSTMISSCSAKNCKISSSVSVEDAQKIDIDKVTPRATFSCDI